MPPSRGPSSRQWRLPSRSFSSTAACRESIDAALKGMEGSGRVEVIPLKFSREHAEARAYATGALYSIRSQHPDNNMIVAMIKSFVGSLFSRPVSTWTIRSLKAIYVPLWRIDGYARIKCKLNAKDSTGYTITTTDFTAPGFAWKPLDQLRFTLEPDQLQNLEAFDLARHRRQHNEDITILPFTRNPFSIASVLRKLVEKHRVLTVPPSKESDEDDDDEVCHNQERVDDAEMLAPLMGPGDPPVIALEAETLEARMAAYPILAPIWMVEFEEPAKEEEEGGKVKRHTMVLRGDTEETGIGARPYWAFWQACTNCGDQSWLPQIFDKTGFTIAGNVNIDGEHMAKELERIAMEVKDTSFPDRDANDEPGADEQEAVGARVTEHIARSHALHQGCILMSAKSQHLAIGPHNVLEPGATDTWVDQPGVMSYSDYGEDHADFLTGFKDILVDKGLMTPPDSLVEVITPTSEKATRV